MTSLGIHYDRDYDVAMNQPITGSVLDRDYMRINVYPPPLHKGHARAESENRGKFYIPQTDTEWIQMVNNFNNGHQEMYYPARSLYQKPPGPKPVRSISANSYFDPFNLRTDVAGSIARDEINEMTRLQMQRAYQRACGKSTTGNRYRERSTKDLRESPGERHESPTVRTRTIPLTPRTAKSFISDNTSGYCTNEEENRTSPFPTQQGKQKPVLPNLSSPSKFPVNLPSRREAWYSAPFRPKIVKQSPPWRSLLNRRPQGVRANEGQLCPKYCRCCFEDTYDSNNKNVFKVDLK